MFEMLVLLSETYRVTWKYLHGIQSLLGLNVEGHTTQWREAIFMVFFPRAGMVTDWHKKQ